MTWLTSNSRLPRWALPALMLALSGAALLAWQAHSAPPPPRPASLELQIRQLVERSNQSPGSVQRVLGQGPGGLHSVLVAVAGKPMQVWVDLPNRLILAGALFDQYGVNHTQLAYQRLENARRAAQPSGSQLDTPPAAPRATAEPAAPAQDLYQALGKLKYLAEGHAGAAVYAFVDPQCSHCASLSRAAAPLLAQGRLRMRWIPVAALGPLSLAQVSAIYGAADPLAALQSFKRQPTLAPPAPAKPNPALDTLISDNYIAAQAISKLASQQGGEVQDQPPATPLIVYRDRQGQARIIPGMPADGIEFLTREAS